MARLTANIAVRNPESGQIHFFSVGQEPPAWVEVGDHILDSSSAPAVEPAGLDEDRPRGNASRDEWAAYAQSLGIEVPEDAGREEIKALVDDLDT